MLTMARQGKCERCKVRYVWEKETPLKTMKCQKCGESLKPTSRQSKLKIIKQFYDYRRGLYVWREME